MLEDDCFYASIISLDKGKKIFKGKCLPNKKIDFNGLGSSHVHLENKIFLSIGAPEQESFDIRELAQKNDSVYGKIVTINKPICGGGSILLIIRISQTIPNTEKTIPARQILA